MPLRRTWAWRRAGLTFLAGVLCNAGHAGAAPFDLAGPVLEVTVTRAGKDFADYAEVPNLAPGDTRVDPGRFSRLAIRPLPDGRRVPARRDQSAARGVVLSLRDLGAPQVRAERAAPSRCRRMPNRSSSSWPRRPAAISRRSMGAVHGRPGALRAQPSQDLNRAALDRSRLERSSLAAIRSLDDADPAKLAQVAPLLARSLAIKVDEKCLDRIARASSALSSRQGPGLAGSE